MKPYLMISFIALVVTSISCNRSATKSPEFNYDFSQINCKIRSWIDSGYYSGAGLIIAKNNQ